MNLSALNALLLFNRLRRSLKKQDYQASRHKLEETAKRFEKHITADVYRFAARGVPCERIMPSQFDRRAVILYFHGGAYVAGSPDTHRHLVSRLAEAAECEIVVPDYRLAPEYPFPYAIDDAMNAFDGLRTKYPASAVFLAGDSAGGGLALAATQKLIEEGKSVAGLLLMAPWVDLRCEGPAYEQFNWYDHILNAERLKNSASQYLGQEKAGNPYASPLLASMEGLPPTLIQTGTHDLLLQDSKALAQKLREARVEVEARYYRGHPHVFQFLWPLFPSGEDAIEAMGAWLKRRK
jgi:acetyl esterase/lipase